MAATTAGRRAARHDDADTSPVTVERSDAIDAAAGLHLLAEKARRDARSRRWAGPQFAGMRRGWRNAAVVYDAAAARMQHEADEALR